MNGTAPSQHPSNPTPAHQFLTLAFSSAMGQLASVAVELRIPDLLAKGQQTVEELASTTNANPKALASVMRTLSALGVFDETSSGRYRLTEIGEIMRTDTPGSLGNFAVAANRDYYHSMWANLSYSVKTGESSFEALHGINIYEFYQNHSEELALFQEALTGQTHLEAKAIKDSYDFSDVGTVVDAGGGRGYLLKMLLEANPKLNGILFDLPSVIDGVARTFESAGLTSRASIIGGNFFESLPRNGDLYVFKRVFVDKNDEQAKQVMANCRAAIGAKGKVLIIDPDIRSLYGKIFDVFMLVMFGSRIRNEEEWASLFADTGFRFSRTIDTSSTLMMVEAEAT